MYSSYRFDDEHTDRFEYPSGTWSDTDGSKIEFFNEYSSTTAMEGVYIKLGNRTSSVDVAVTQRGTRRLDVFLYLAEPSQDGFISSDNLVKRIREDVLDEGTVHWTVRASEFSDRDVALVFDYSDDGEVPARSERDYLDPPGAVVVTWKVRPSSLASFWLLLASVGGLAMLLMAWGGRRWVRRDKPTLRVPDGDGKEEETSEVEELLEQYYIWPP